MRFFFRFLLKLFFGAKRGSPEAALVDYAATAIQYGDINDKLSSTPKSLSSMNRIYLPQIQEDFPEFNWNEFIPVIQRAILDMLTAIDSRDPGPASSIPPIHAAVTGILAHEEVPHYKNIRIHNTVIKNYYREDGTCFIITESSVEYFTYIEREGRVVRGYKDRKRQTVYETELVYVQDRSKLKGSPLMGFNCPNCGAPITNLGAKFCEYCGLAVVTVNRNVWQINSIKES